MPRLRLIVLLCLLFAAPVVHAEPPTRLPDVAEVREEALRYANLHRAPDRWSARARWRNLVPEISASVGWLDEADEGTAFHEYLTRNAAGDLLFDTARTSNDSSKKFRLQYTVRATVDFRGLIFDRDELSAAREARAQAEHRQLLVTLVHETYFERLAVLEALDEQATGDPALQRRARQLDARLDGLTGGWFSTRLKMGGR